MKTRQFSRQLEDFDAVGNTKVQFVSVVLSDGSIVYNIEIRPEHSSSVTIGCSDKKSALALYDIITSNTVVYIE